MRIRLALLMVVVVVGTTACGIANRIVGGEQRCTLIGCESQVAVNVTGRAMPAEGGVVQVRMCFDDTCDSQRLRFKGNGAVVARSSSDVSVFSLDDDLVATLRLPKGDYDEATEHRVTAEIVIDDADPVRVERDVTLNRSQPNGADCGPICWQATIEV